MYKVTIKGEAGECSHPEVLSELHYVDCQDEFVEYMDRGTLQDKLESGYLHFEYENGKLYSVVCYSAKEELTKEELDELIDYTSGQLSDGIGEGFEQQPCYYTDDDDEVFVSPWFRGQKLVATQEK